MIINVINQQTSLRIATEQVENLVYHVIKEEGWHCDEVSIYFIDTPSICELHAQFFDDPTPTDCISFPIDEKGEETGGYVVLGDVFVCPETAILYATEHRKDPYEETTLYIVHGLLHLMGYDDIDKSSCLLMREAESRHMKSLQHSSRILNGNLLYP